MDRYTASPYQAADWDWYVEFDIEGNGDWVKYSDVKELQAKLKHYEKSVTSASVESRHLQDQQAIKKLREETIKIRDVIRSQSIDSFGEGRTIEGQPYPIREEIVDRLTKLLNETSK